MIASLALQVVLAAAVVTEPPAPRPSVVWVRPSASVAQSLASVPKEGTSPASRGLLIGGVIGGLAGGLFGNRVCHGYGLADADGCTGPTLWWGVAGGLLGGLLGAIAGGEENQAT